MTDDERNLETFFQNAVVGNSSNAQNRSEPSPDFIGKLEAARSAVLNDTPRDEVANIIDGIIDEIKEDLGISGSSSRESEMLLRFDS